MAFKLEKFVGAQDMTTGSPASCLVQFSVPLLVGNLAQQLYNTVDSIVVGKYVGDGALAAVGASNPLLNLIPVSYTHLCGGRGAGERGGTRTFPGSNAGRRIF